MEQLTVVAKIKIRPDVLKEAIVAIEALVKASRAEVGMINYDFHQSVDDPTEFVVYENYKNEEAFRTHSQSAHHQEFSQKVRTWLTAPPEVKKYKIMFA